MVQDAADYIDMEQLWYGAPGAEQLQLATVEDLQLTAPEAGRLKLASINDRTAAEAMRGSILYQPLAKLPTLEEGQFYYFEVIGFAVVDEQGQAFGRVLGVDDMPGQDLLRVLHPKGKAFLLPITDDTVLAVDRAAKQLMVRLPNGLLEVYLEG